MKVVAFVPIKLNSQRIPHKNLLDIGGKPLCWHIVNTLLQVNKIDEVYVFCSDKEVKKYIPEKAIFLKRDPVLDGNEIKGNMIYTSFINLVDADYYVLAHTTSPFTKQASVDNALKNVLSGEYDSAFSARKIQTFCWYKGKPINYSLEDVPRTQDLEPIFMETSAFFIFKKELFTKYNRRIGFKPYIQMVDDIEGVDIDEPSDYELAAKLAKVR